MQTILLLDPQRSDGALRVEVEAANELAPAYVELLEAMVRSTGVVVDTQGLSASRQKASLAVRFHGADARKRLVVFDLKASGAPASTWRVLNGLIRAFDVASAPLAMLRIEQAGHERKPRSEREILSIPYPRRVRDPGFAFEHSEGQGMDRSVEVELTDDVPADSRAAVVDALNAWLLASQGGFFEDGQDPVTNAHDCPKVDDIAEQLLVARFEMFAGSEAAFDVVVNQLAFLHQRLRCIASLRMY